MVQVAFIILLVSSFRA